MGRASKGRDVAAVHAGAIILVRPQLGENIGMAARAMLNCGLSTLQACEPLATAGPMTRRNVRRRAPILCWRSAEVFETVGRGGCRPRTGGGDHGAQSRAGTQRILTPRQAASEDARLDRARARGSASCSGPERTGLENDDMVHADTALSIPLNPQFSSLNMAQAVLLVAYEWTTAGDTTPACAHGRPRGAARHQGGAAEPVRPSRARARPVGLPAQQGDAALDGAQSQARCCSAPR